MGACCFRTAQAAREELGLPWPAEHMSDWYTRARHGHWETLRRDWDELTVQIQEPVAGALLRLDNPTGSFGVGVLVDSETLVTVRHQGRLLVVLRRAMGPHNLYQLR